MRLLIIDDDDKQLQIFAMILGQLRPDWVITTCVASSDWCEASMQKARIEEDADVVLLDVRLNHWDGLDLVAMCARRAPVIMMSGTVDALLHKRCCAAGALSLLQKPTSRGQALAILEACEQAASQR